MSKEYLDAFKIVYNNFDYLISDVCIENDDVNICLKTIKEQLPTIKQALKRLESIDNADSSEALECLEALEQDIKDRTILAEDRQLKLCEIIKQALLKAQKEHEILETIKEKSSNSGLCIDYLKTNKYYPNMQDYKHYCMTIREFYRVNEETFNILKEWVLND